VNLPHDEHTSHDEHAPYEEMAASYALGALDGPDRAALEQHLDQGCTRCRELYPDLSRTAEALLLAIEPINPPAALRGRILAAAGVHAGAPEPMIAGGHLPASEPGPEPRSRPHIAREDARHDPGEPPVEFRRRGREALYASLALAAGLALLVIAWQSLVLRDEMADVRAEAEVNEREATRLAAELSDLKLKADEQARLIELLRRPSSGVITLASLKPAPGSSGRVLFDPEAGRGYLWVHALPPDPAGKDYQLWAIIDNQPVSAGVFSVGPDGSALVPLAALGPDLKGVGAFAITLEPEGGVPSPSGDMVLIGKTGA
jgi:anti-sigma-K factor RskA